MENKPKVSIIVPFYNVEKYLARGLDCLVKQTLKDIEIICIDDGSSDNSGEIANEYAKNDSRIRVIRQSNGGAAVARNAGLAIANGEFIGFLDSDDFVDFDFYEKLYARADETGADIAKGEGVQIDFNGNQKSFGSGHEIIMNNKANFHSSFTSAIYRRKFLADNNIDFPNGVITGQDSVFLTKAVLCANRIECVGGTYYHYIRREGSLDSLILNDKKIQSKIDRAKLIFDYINGMDLDTETYGIIFSRTMRSMFRFFYRSPSSEMRRRMALFMIKEYKKCKYPTHCIPGKPLYSNLLKTESHRMLFWCMTLRESPIRRFGRWLRYRKG